MRRAAVTATILAASIFSIGGTLAGDPVAGRVVFLNQCVSCHSMTCHRQHGPALGELFGRTAANLTDFRYSDALRASGIVWDEERLNGFLSDPSAFVPGTRMTDGPGARVSVPDAQDRADLIAYLLTGDTSLDLC